MPAPPVSPARERPPPWWLRAYLLIGMVQGLAIGLTGLFAPEHVVGFPLAATPLNTRFVAGFYLAGAVGLGLAALSRRAVDARIMVAAFAAVTLLLLVATVRFWDAFTADGVPYAWLVSYIADPIVGVATLAALGLWTPVRGGAYALSPVFLTLMGVAAVLGLVLLLAPDTAADLWPWALPRTLAAVYASVFLGLALGAALAAREGSPAAVRPYVVTVLVFLALAAVVSLVHRERFSGGASAWVWALALGLGIGGSALATFRPAAGAVR